MTVFSFVAASDQNSFNGDLNDFIQYLVESHGYSGSQCLYSIGAGTEPFTGTNAEFITTGYSVSVSAGDSGSDETTTPSQAQSSSVETSTATQPQSSSTATPTVTLSQPSNESTTTPVQSQPSSVETTPSAQPQPTSVGTTTSARAQPTSGTGCSRRRKRRVSV
jgi:xyloglucan-specific endo-beta-1,4-glucanase